MNLKIYIDIYMWFQLSPKTFLFFPSFPFQQESNLDLFHRENCTPIITRYNVDCCTTFSSIDVPLKIVSWTSLIYLINCPITDNKMRNDLTEANWLEWPTFLLYTHKKGNHAIMEYYLPVLRSSFWSPISWSKLIRHPRLQGEQGFARLGKKVAALYRKTILGSNPAHKKQT